MEKTLRIKKVSDEQELALSRLIREQVFCEEQNVSREAEFDGLDHASDHFLCFRNEIPIGTGRLREKTSGVYKVERVAVVAKERLKGVGELLIRAITEEWERKKYSRTLTLHSQIQVESFYKKLGFLSVGEVFIEEGIPHVKMVLERNLETNSRDHE